jgi:RimJ/RimL family protein N-acetyltransferase
MKIQIKAPKDCAADEIAAFEVLVRAGGEVEAAGLRERICRASRLLFLYDADGVLAGVSALKHPDEDYRSKVFRRAHAAASPLSYPAEIGWIFVLPAHQRKGFSRLLVEHLLSHANQDLVYATTRVDNERMQRTLARYHFRQEGGAYPSVRGDYELALFVQHATAAQSIQR